MDNIPQDSSIPVEGFRLELVASGDAIFPISEPSLTGKSQYFNAVGTWPSDGSSIGTRMRVVLPGTGNPDHPVYFRQVQVDEDYAEFRYEHDLVPFKPYADIIILSQATGLPGGQVSINTDAGLHLERTFAGEIFPIRAILGWAPRVNKEEYIAAPTLEDSRQHQA